MLSSSDPVKSLLSEDNPKAKDFVAGTWPCAVDNGATAYDFKLPRATATGSFYPNKGYPGLSNAAFGMYGNAAAMISMASPRMFGHPGGDLNNDVFDFEMHHFASRAVTDNSYFHNFDSLAASKASQIHRTPVKNAPRAIQMTSSPEDESSFSSSQSSIASSPPFGYLNMPSIKLSPMSQVSNFSMKSSPVTSFSHDSMPSSSSSSPQSFQNQHNGFNMMTNVYAPESISSFFSSPSTISSSPSVASIKTPKKSKSNASGLKAKTPKRRRIRNAIPADGIIFKSKSLLNKRGSSCFPIGSFVVRLCDYSDDLTLFNNSVWNVTNHNLLQRYEYCMHERGYNVYKPTDRYTRWLPQFPDEYILIDDVITINASDALRAVMLPKHDKVVLARKLRDEKRLQHGLPVPTPSYLPLRPPPMPALH